MFAYPCSNAPNPPAKNSSQPCPSFPWLFCSTKEKPPKLPRIFCPCRTHNNPGMQEKAPILARKFLAKNQPRKSKQSRKGRSGNEPSAGMGTTAVLALVRQRPNPELWVANAGPCASQASLKSGLRPVKLRETQGR